MTDKHLKTSRASALKALADQTLEVPDLKGLTHLLTAVLPETLAVSWGVLLIWNRKLDSFETLSESETTGPAVWSEPGRPATPEARFLISEGELIETPSKDGKGVLLPLMARSGLVGMLMLAERPGKRALPYSRPEVRALSLVANRAALAVENHLYQRELISSERMAALGTMAGMLVHDFRGPMTVIRGYAEMLLETETDAEEVRSRARSIVDMVDRLDRMTNETLDFARGGERLALRNVTLLSMLEELVADISEQQPGLQVAPELRIDPELRAALDVDKLRRTVGNIAANAADAMRGRGKLHVSAWLGASTEDEPPRLVLRLEDEGPGIPEKIRERLFEPFVTSGKKQGTGLGLAVAKRFVEDHGGHLELLPEGPGARFQITLPIAPAAGRGSDA